MFLSDQNLNMRPIVKLLRKSNIKNISNEFIIRDNSNLIYKYSDGDAATNITVNQIFNVALENYDNFNITNKDTSPVLFGARVYIENNMIKLLEPLEFKSGAQLIFAIDIVSTSSDVKDATVSLLEIENIPIRELPYHFIELNEDITISEFPINNLGTSSIDKLWFFVNPYLISNDTNLSIGGGEIVV